MDRPKTYHRLAIDKPFYINLKNIIYISLIYLDILKKYYIFKYFLGILYIYYKYNIYILLIYLSNFSSYNLIFY